MEKFIYLSFLVLFGVCFANPNISLCYSQEIQHISFRTDSISLINYLSKLTVLQSGDISYHAERKLPYSPDTIFFSSSFQFSNVSGKCFTFKYFDATSTGDTVIKLLNDTSQYAITISPSRSELDHTIEERKIFWENITVYLEDNVYSGLVTSKSKYFSRYFANLKQIERKDTILNGTKCVHFKLSHQLADTNVKFFRRDFYFKKSDSTLLAYKAQYQNGDDFVFYHSYLDSIYKFLSTNVLEKIISTEKEKYLKTCTYRYFDPHIPVCPKPQVGVKYHIGDTVYNLTGQDTQNNFFSLSNVKAKLVLLEFWFIGCAPCALSNPILLKLKNEYKKDALEIISINSSDRINSIAKYAKQHKMSNPFIVIDQEIEKKFPIDGFPTFLLLDQDHKLIGSMSGYSVDLYDRLKHLIEKYK